jgi:hypothetical protein
LRPQDADYGDGPFIGPDIIGPDIIGPDIIGPDIIGPDIIGPDIIGPDIIGPDIIGPEVLTYASIAQRQEQQGRVALPEKLRFANGPKLPVAEEDIGGERWVG